MKTKKSPTLAMMLLLSMGVNAQVYFTEGFENGSKPTGWSEVYVSGTEPWRYRNGGHSPNDNNWLIPAYEEDITRNPPSAHSGTYNAIFFKQSTNNERTKLVTKPIDLSQGIQPELSFWLCQVPWSFSGTTNWDILRVYYKTSFGGDWTLLAEYLDPLEEWVQYKINLPNPSATYYIAFEGQTRWGFGTCIDDISIEERGVQARYVSELTVSQADYTFVPSGSDNEPILRLGFKVFGNSGTATLSTIVVKSANTNDTDIATDGVKLYATPTMLFNTENQLDGNVNFSNGYATFSNLNLNLPNGQSYIWLTYDVKSNATHGNLLDAILEAKSIQVGDSLYPKLQESPTGNRVIYETIYRENFDGTHGWTLTGEFEIDSARGKGGEYIGYPDPSSAYSGGKVLGTDLTGLGITPGDYENNIAESNAYRATSPAINALFFKDIKSSYRRYLNIEVWDRATVDVSKNNGSTWSNIWYNNNYYTDTLWNKTSHDVPSALSRSNQLKFRFKLGPTDATTTYSGWNVDDFTVTGDYITKDVGVVEWVYPQSGCGNSATDSVIVKVTNLGAETSPSSIPVQYSFNNGTSWVTNFINQSIAPGDTIEFTFPTKVDLTSPGIKYVKARTKLTGDEDASNDGISGQVYIVPTYQLPYAETFESNDGYWRSFGTSLWQWGLSAKPSINGGTKLWITSSTQNYGDALLGDADTLFFDNFEANNGWALNGEFELATPVFLSDTIPYYTYSGMKCLGTDLTRKGTIKGMYESNATWSATLSNIDVSGYTNLKMSFLRWFKFAEGDTAKVQVSNNGTSWSTIWSNNGTSFSDDIWTETSIDVPDNINNGNSLWVRFALASNSDASVAEGINIDDFMLTGNPYSSGFAYAQSPCFDFSGVTNPVIDLSVYTHSEAETDGTTLMYSVDKGNTWNYVENSEVYDTYWNWYTDSTIAAIGKDGWNGVDDQWRTSKHLLPAAMANQGNVIFRMAFKSNKTNNDFGGTAFDDINLYEAPFDVGVESILSPATSCDLSNEQEIQLRIKNYGVRAMSTGDTIALKVKVEHSMFTDIQTDTIILSADMPVGSNFDYTFSKKFNMSISGFYTITAGTLIEKDPLFYSSVQNDSTSMVVEVQKSYIELGDDIYTLSPDTVILVATNPDPTVTYEWYQSPDLTTVISTNDSLTVPTIDGGTFVVALTNTVPCTAYDSVTVHRLIRDVGISAFDSPVSSCELPAETPLKAFIKNYGTDTLALGDTLRLSYIFNGGSQVDSVWAVNTTLLPNDSLSFAFDTLLDMEAIGAYTLKSWATVDLDEDADNDTTNVTVNVWGYPSFSLQDTMGLPNDSVDIFNISYTLDAGTWGSYLWLNDSSTNQTFVLDYTDWGRVTVFDEHQCPATDSVFVNLKYSDVAVDTVINPNSACEVSGTIYPHIVIRNTGTDTLTVGTDIYLKFYFNAVLQESPTLTLDSKLPPNDTRDVIFGTGIDISAINSYTLDFVASAALDLKPDNDSIHHVISVFGYPTVELGDSVFTRDASYTIDAGAGHDSYSWSNGATTQQVTVSQSNKYKVTVTDNGICPAEDSVVISFLRHNYAITQLVNPTTSCSSSAPQPVVLKFSNVGNDTLKAGQQVKFGYQINEDIFAEENYTLTADLTPGHFLEYTFSEYVDFSAVGSYEVVAYGISPSDINTSNDTLNTTIEIKATPTVNLGEDRIIRTVNETLDGGEGTGYTYQWQDNSTSQYFFVENTGYYWVTTTAPNGCYDQDTVYIQALKPDYKISAINSPVTACQLSDNEPVVVEIENCGTDTLQTGQTLYISYEVNNSLQGTQPVTMTTDFKPGEKITRTFNKTYNFETAGSYSVKAYTAYSGDLNPYNDDITSNVSVWGLPAVNLGADTAICEGSSITLNPENSGTSYLWSTGETTQSIQVSTENDYWLNLTDSHGCSNRDTITVTVNSLPVVAHSAIDPVCSNTAPFTLTGGSPAGGTYSGAGASGTTFDASAAGIGVHTLTYLYTDANGCSSSTPANITVNAAPAINLGENQSINEALTLDAGEGFTAYLWQDNSTNQTLTVETTGLYSVTVTDANGCEGYDEVYITFLGTLDVVVSDLISPISQCYENTEQPVTVELTNQGSKTFVSGEQITVSYRIGSGEPVGETLTFTENFAQNDKLQHSFSNGVMHSTGTFTYTCYTTIEGNDGNPNEFNVTIHPLPNLNLGPDTIKTSLPYVLQAGIANVTYLWNTGATSPSITVSQHGDYWLRVTNSNGCIASDTVVIWQPDAVVVISGINATVELFPNPVKDELNVRFDSEKETAYTIELINPQGLVVCKLQTAPSTKATEVINVSNLTSGLYLLRVSAGNGSAIFKVIVN